MAAVVVEDRKQSGQYDLEAVEMLTRATMQKLGGVFLETLLNADGGVSGGAALRCEQGHRIAFVEVREREVQTVVGTIRLRRGYYYDAACGRGRCPKDEELGIVGSSFSPGVRRMMSRVGAYRPFALGEEDLRELAGLDVNAKAIERECHRLGPDAETFSRRPEVASQGAPIKTLYICMDGTGVPVVRAETVGRKGKDGPAKTREVKLGCVFTQTTVDKDGYPVRDEHSTTYVGRIEKSEDFGRRLYLEAVRRGLHQAQRLVVMGDAAEWIWNIVAECFPDAIRIVDLYHAREHYWTVARLMFPALSKRLHAWTENRKAELDAGDVEAVIRALKRLSPRTAEQRDRQQKEMEYFAKHKEQMRYARFRAQGLFVGSGVVEAGCRSLIAHRLKQSGMHWTVNGANSVIALPCLLFSNRWEDFWQYRAVA